MPLLVHLSDLHMARNPGAQSGIFDGLVRALGVVHRRHGGQGVTVVVTGDVFESSTLSDREAVDGFLHLHERIVEALGGDAPFVVLPGNHDRRRFGLLGPGQTRLFQALYDAADPRQLFVAGCERPFLAQLVPDAFHRLPAHVITYDSTYLPGGLVGAGGTLRIEDLLMVGARLPDDGQPVLVLTHHHLIPTPLTDVSHIDAARSNRLARWMVNFALPALVSYGDREELTMTALGAGTALTTLQNFGRAVLLLHGHKHVPSARLLVGATAGSGDVLIASAGSAGTRERVHEQRHPDAARLWPSFNLVQLSASEVHIESLAFSPKSNTRPAQRRELASTRRVGAKWVASPVSAHVHDPAPRVEADEAEYTLRDSTSAHYWDYVCERRVQLREDAHLRRYVEFLRVPPSRVRGHSLLRKREPIEVEIGGATRYQQQAALCRTARAATWARGPLSAFEWVGLLCRYGASRATLRLSQPTTESLEPFGSVTDLTSGAERPYRLASTGNAWSLTAEACAPRSLLRIYWPLSSRAL